MRVNVRFRPFSLRHSKSINAGTLVVELLGPIRRRLWATLLDRNGTLSYSEDDNPNWILTTSVLAESETIYERLLGLESIRSDEHSAGYAKRVIDSDEGHLVLSFLEVFYATTLEAQRADVQEAVNDAFLDFGCPWRLADGLTFRVDSEFLEQEVVGRSSELLTAPGLEGALAEFKTARDHLTEGSIRDAVVYSAHSIESTLKALLEIDTGVATDLLKQLAESPLMDDVPLSKARLVTKTLGSVAVLRNELGGHGQGVAIVHVPRAYGELAVHLTAAIQHFLISQQLARRPTEPKEQEPAAPPHDFDDLDPDIPF